jgi:hypothetical protein
LTNPCIIDPLEKLSRTPQIPSSLGVIDPHICPPSRDLAAVRPNGPRTPRGR